MVKKLKQFGMNSLLQFAEAVANKKCAGVDRLARRQRNSLICWFCENYLELLNDISLMFATHQQPFEPIPSAKRNELAFFQVLEQAEVNWEWSSSNDDTSF
jgi:hypothetical protein